MINKLKTFAIAILVTGATVAATRSNATPAPDTNTFTNVIQDITISLTVYSNAPINSAATKQSGEKPVTVTTKSVLTALSNASASIPSLVGFDWGKSPKLVIDTTFSNTIISNYTTNGVSTNSVALSTNGPGEIVFQPTNDTFPGTGTEVIIPDTNGSAMITNNTVGTNGGTNVLTAKGDWTSTGNSITNLAFSYIGTNGETNLGPAIPTNGWTVITAATNGAGGTNIIVTSYTNFVSSTSNSFATNSQGVEVEGGTAKDPTFANVSEYVSDPAYASVVITATGTGLGTTNPMVATETDDSWNYFSLHLFTTTSSTAPGNNLELTVYGFSKDMKKYDVLKKSRTGGTDQVGVDTFSASVSGYGDIGGSYTTNTDLGTNGTAISLPTTQEFSGIGSVTNTNSIPGSLTNPIPVVVEGTISLGAPSSPVAQ